MLSETFSFWRAWLRAPRSVGAVAPSGPSLARLMTRHVDHRDGPVIELGPGTGVLTKELIRRFGRRRVLAVETNPVFVRNLNLQFADEAIILLGCATRLPELLSQQVMAVANMGEKHLPFFAGYLLSFAYLKEVAEVLGDTLSAGGKYFLFCNNIDLSKKYQVPYKGAMFYVLPIDESTVYNELLDLLYLEKNDLKKKDTAGKLDAVADAALKYDVTFDTITYEEGLALMGPVRNPNENRPV